MTIDRTSINIHYARSIAKAARRIGLDDQSLLQQAGIDPQLCADTGRRLRMTPEQFADLLLGFWQTANDEFLGMASRPCKHGTFALMARQAVNQTTLRGVYRHLSRFYALFTDAIELQLKEDGNRASFIMTQQDSSLDPDHTFAEFFLLLWHRFPGWLIGRFIPLLEIQLPWPAPPHAREYRLIYPGPARFEQPQMALVFQRQLLDEPLVQTEQTLKSHLENAPLVWVNRPNFYPHFSRQVINQLNTCTNPAAADMETVARRLHLTSRTLRRKLTLEKTSFQALKDKSRRDLAIRLLNRPELNLSQISAQLGFSDPAAFSRAFKQWMGVPPSFYRRDK